MSSSHFLRLATIAGSGKFLAAARHNKRALQNERGSAGHIDPALSHLNYPLLELATPEEVYQRAKMMMHTAGLAKLRKNGVAAIEIIFSLPAHSQIEHHTYFVDCTDWAATQFGRENLLSSDVHLDEAAPHCHVLVLPLRGGRMQGSDVMGDRQAMLKRQASFYEAVSSRHGLTKPLVKQRVGNAQQQLLDAAVMAHLMQTSDVCQKSVLWPLARD